MLKKHEHASCSCIGWSLLAPSRPGSSWASEDFAHENWCGDAAGVDILGNKIRKLWWVHGAKNV